MARKQERLAELLAKPRRRRDVLRTLCHFEDLDPRFMTKVPPAEQTADRIESLLRARGAPEQCYAISTDEYLDGRTVTLRDALTRIIGVGHGTLLVRTWASRTWSMAHAGKRGSLNSGGRSNELQIQMVASRI